MAAEQSTSSLLYDASQLPKECLMHSEKFLGETENARGEKLLELLSWIDTQTDFAALRKYDTVWLIYFLRATKFRIEKTKCKILK